MSLAGGSGQLGVCPGRFSLSPSPSFLSVSTQGAPLGYPTLCAVMFCLALCLTVRESAHCGLQPL